MLPCGAFYRGESDAPARMLDLGSERMKPEQTGKTRSRSRVAWTAIVAVVVATGFALSGCVDPLELHDFSDIPFLFNVPVTDRTPPVAGPSVFHDEAIFEEIPDKIGHHAASITVLANDELLAAWYSYTGPHELDGAAIFTSRRSASSAAWSAPRLEIARDTSCGNPVLYSEGNDVWLFFAVVPFGWSTAHIETQRSSDGGHTWSPSIEVPGPLGSNVRYPPLRLHDGRMLLPAYDDLFHRSLFFASNDGDDWQLQVILPGEDGTPPIQPSIVQFDGGRLLAVMRNASRGWLQAAASDDGGETWTRPADSGFPNPDSAAALFRLANGHLILIFNDSFDERRPLSVALSADEGVTWPFRRALADGSETYSYPSAAQTSDGLIHIVYSLERRSIQHATFNEQWIVNGG